VGNSLQRGAGFAHSARGTCRTDVCGGAPDAAEALAPITGRERTEWWTGDLPICGDGSNGCPGAERRCSLQGIFRHNRYERHDPGGPGWPGAVVQAVLEGRCPKANAPDGQVK
jgi:hypothetical protein